MSDFVGFARAHGLIIRDLDATGRLARVPTVDHPRRKDGAYRWDGVTGFVYRWDEEAKPIWFDAPDRPQDTAQRALRERMAQQHRAEMEQGWARAAQEAQRLLVASGLGHHAYLDSKGLRDAQGFVDMHGALIVPMRSLSGELRGAQVIRETSDGFDKRMLPGMRAKGAVFRIGPPGAVLTVLCEGYATGLSISEAIKQMRLNWAVLVCFSAGNLEYVAPLVRGAKGVFADHDKSGRGEQAAKTTGLPYVMSDVVGEDANDLHQRAGLIALCAKLQRLRW
ncbi:MAG: toprim domain-containing protein [Thiomonas sp.]